MIYNNVNYISEYLQQINSIIYKVKTLKILFEPNFFFFTKFTQTLSKIIFTHSTFATMGEKKKKRKSVKNYIPVAILENRYFFYRSVQLKKVPHIKRTHFQVKKKKIF